MDFRNIEGVVFDMDGTLVDSEPLSWRAIQKALQARDISTHGLDAATFHGWTWEAIATELNTLLTESHAPLSYHELQATFHALHHTEPPPLIPGALDALLAARSRVPTAICTSSQRESLLGLLQRLELPDLAEKSVCAEDCTRSKPDPQGYALAASRLGVSPERCLVFEDSLAGIQAAQAAGMKVIAIVGSHGPDSALAQAADVAIADYTHLPSHFFEISCR